jgi:hypothetical protein
VCPCAERTHVLTIWGMDTAPELLGAFAAARTELETTTGDDPWETSPFRWIRDLQSRRRGKAGELIISNWLRELNVTVGRSSSSGSDRTAGLQQVEIKLSTQWDTGQFAFQQLRDQDYHYVILLGITPDEARIWVLPKAVAMRHSTPQHTGSQGAETRWLCFDAANPPVWLDRYGGTPQRSMAAVARYLKPGVTATTEAQPSLVEQPQQPKSS